MMRLAIAGAVALLLHGLVLAVHIDGLSGKKPPRPVAPGIRVTMAPRVPPPPPKPEAPAVPEIPIRSVPTLTAFKASVIPHPAPVPVRRKKSEPAPRKRHFPVGKIERRIDPLPVPVFEPAAPVPAGVNPDPAPVSARPTPSPGPPATAAAPAKPASPPEPTKAPTKDVEAIPRYGRNPNPGYPRAARKRGYEGTVTLRVLVNRDGRVTAIEVETSSGHAILDGAAMKTVRKWDFVPGQKNGKTVDMWVRVPVRFQLR